MRRSSVVSVLLLFFLLCADLVRLATTFSHPPDYRPEQAVRRFPVDFPPVTDNEWGFPLGGWGGLSKGHSLHYNPVIFVHGNTRDATDWNIVRKWFKEAGYSDQELWALSYNGKGSPQGFTDNNSNTTDLYEFVVSVQAYTGAEKVDIVAHSLGVTLARRVMCDREMHAIVEDFVGIAGPNHGATGCRAGGLFTLCNEIAPGSEWLRKLNQCGGRGEAPGPTRYLMIYNGGGRDIFFQRSPWWWNLLFWIYSYDDRASPPLTGAENLTFPDLDHDQLRFAGEAVSVYRHFVQGHNDLKTLSLQK